MTKKTVLVTGGLGYIGSHTVCSLVENGYQVVIIDDLSNSNKNILDKLKAITGFDIPFFEGSYGDKKLLSMLLEHHKIDAVILFSGSKYVAESIEKPATYYRNNVSNLISFMDFALSHDWHHIIFSSSATVYGDNHNLPIKESEPLLPPSPYGHTKAMVEQILTDYVCAYRSLKICLLRYFNPTGAHKSGLIGESYNDQANNLVPIIMQVLLGQREYVSVFGDDYDTKDGSGIRDYIHVCDLAYGHVLALDKLLLSHQNKFVYNLGTGLGYSVFDMIKAFEKVSGQKIPYQIKPRRKGDIAVSYADVSLAKKELRFIASHTLNDMALDVWRYIKTTQ